MEAAIQRATEDDATIDSVLRSTGVHETLTNLSNSNLYFTALNTAATSTASNASTSSAAGSGSGSATSSSSSISPHNAGIVGLLLLPAAEVMEGSHLSVDQCRLYLRVVARHVDSILGLWDNGQISHIHFHSLMKAVRAAAVKCSESGRRHEISSSGILPALAKLALNYNHYTSFEPPIAESPSLLATKFQQMTGRGQANATATAAAVSARHNQNLYSGNSNKRAVPNPNILTLAHAEFVTCCTLAAQYHYASRMISHYPIYAVGPPSKVSSHAMVSETFLRYWYHVGVIHLACDEYTLAIRAFRNCITVPSKSVSAITIQARKKSLLASCLLLEREEEETFTVVASSMSSLPKQLKNTVVTGKEEHAQSLAFQLLSYPDATCSVVSRYFVNAAEGASPNTGESSSGLDRQHRGMQIMGASGGGGGGTSAPSSYASASLLVYDELVIAYASCDFGEFDRIFNTHAQVWDDDGNVGLVKRVQALMTQRKIRKLAKIYKAIPLDKLQSLLGLADDDDLNPNQVESALMQIAFQQEQMTASSSPLTRMPIDFSIDKEKSNVYFYLDGECGDGEEEHGGMDRIERDYIQEELSKRITTCMKLAERVTNLDIAVAVSGKYQAAVVKDEASKGAPRSVVDIS